MAKTRYPELDLDLTFSPIACAEPRAFTQDQIRHYNSQGYVAGIPLFAGDELAQLTEDCRTSRDGLGDELNPHAHIGWVHDLARRDNLQPYLQDLIGPNIICFISEYINKPPGSEREVVGHQDAAFNAMDARSVIVWVAVEDADTGNGCMWFCPGSHLGGALDVEDPKGNLNTSAAAVDEAVTTYGKVPIELRAGQAVFFSDLVIHISPRNTSATRSRPAITFTFTSAETVVHPHPAARHEPILCGGASGGGHWDLLPRPE